LPKKILLSEACKQPEIPIEYATLTSWINFSHLNNSEMKQPRRFLVRFLVFVPLLVLLVPLETVAQSSSTKVVCGAIHPGRRGPGHDAQRGGAGRIETQESGVPQGHKLNWGGGGRVESANERTIHHQGLPSRLLLKMSL
jgi:hypothetical protein